MTKRRPALLIQPDAAAPSGSRSLATPIYRGSTMLFRHAHEVEDD